MYSGAIQIPPHNRDVETSFGEGLTPKLGDPGEFLMMERGEGGLQICIRRNFPEAKKREHADIEKPGNQINEGKIPRIWEWGVRFSIPPFP